MSVKIWIASRNTFFAIRSPQSVLRGEDAGESFRRFDSLSLGNEREDQAQLSSIHGMRFHRSDHAAHSRQALSDGFTRRVLDSSRLFQTIAYVSNLWKEKRNAQALASTVYKDEAVSAEAEAGIEYSLGQLQKSCRDSGARLVVAYAPSIGDIQAIQQTTWVETLLRVCNSNQIELLDLTPVFKEASIENPTKLYFPNDEHWNAQGHQVAGEFINAYLQHK